MGNICASGQSAPNQNQSWPKQLTRVSEKSGFNSTDKGEILCDGVVVEEIRQMLGPTTPFFLYSQEQLVRNLDKYMEAVKSLPCKTLVGYSMKANNNLAIMRQVKNSGAGVVAVSGNEVRTAIEIVGIAADKIVYNGNGKTLTEIKYAVG